MIQEQLHQPGAVRPWVITMLALAMAYFASVVFIPIFVALFLAMLLDPVVNGLQRRGLPRAPGALVTVVVFLTLLALAVYGLYLSVAELANSLPLYREKIQHFAAGLQRSMPSLDTVFPPPAHAPGTPLIQKVEIVEKYPQWSYLMIRGVGTLYELVATAIFVPLLLLYFLIEKADLLESGNALVSKYAYIPRLNGELPRMVRAFLVGNAATGLLLMIGHTATLYALGFGNWLSLGMLTGLLNLVPLIGAPLALLLPVGQALAQFDSLSPLALYGGLTLIFHLISNNLVLPLIVGNRINVSSSAMVVGFLFWGWLWGAIGFLLAIPMTALLKIVFESNRATFGLANMLAARPRHVLPSRAGSPLPGSSAASVTPFPARESVNPHTLKETHP